MEPLVGKGGLEPPSLSAHDPKSCSSANSDTPPLNRIRRAQFFILIRNAVLKTVKHRKQNRTVLVWCKNIIRVQASCQPLNVIARAHRDRGNLIRDRARFARKRSGEPLKTGVEPDFNAAKLWEAWRWIKENSYLFAG